MSFLKQIKCQENSRYFNQKYHCYVLNIMAKSDDLERYHTVLQGRDRTSALILHTNCPESSLYFRSWAMWVQNKNITPVTSKHYVSTPITNKLFSLNFWHESLMCTANRVPQLMMFISFTASLILSNLYSHYIYNPLSINSLAISYVTLTYTYSLHSVCQISCPLFNY